MSEQPQVETAEDLIARMMRKKLFVVFSACQVPPSDLRQNLKSHLKYLIELEKRGLLFASGPTFGEDGEMAGDGLTILKASSFEEAAELAAKDPFVIAGQRKFTIKSWILNEGRISISVNISDCTVELT